MAYLQYFMIHVFLTLGLLFHVISEDLCNNVENCFHNKSGLCAQLEGAEYTSCDFQLKSEDLDTTHCRFERPTECYIEAPSSVSGPYGLPFVIQMYYYKTWMVTRPVVNITFLKPNWQSAEFQYQDSENKDVALCRKFSLTNISSPLMYDLSWDCSIFDDTKYVNHNFDLFIITREATGEKRGIGGKYSFKVPNATRFNPYDTMLKDWEVFFFLHGDHIGKSVNIPVTVQLVPFNHANISYNISLMNCLQDDDNCSQHSTRDSILIKNPEVNATSLNDIKQITTLLSSSGTSSPGKYIVSVQVVSPECTVTGCFTAFSPVFSIEASQIGLWITIALGLIVIFALAYFITLYNRTKANKKLLTSLRENPPSVLLLYLPENDACLKLVETFASFLKGKCYVDAHFIDSDVGNETPATWTVTQMNEADKLLFVMPNNPISSSVTPIVNQWAHALEYFSGPTFFENHASKAAVILLPFSSEVPVQINSVKRFILVRELPSLVTWIHGGSWLDEKIIWGPEIKSSSNESITPSLTKLLEIVNRAQQDTKCGKGNHKVKPDEMELLKCGNLGEKDSEKDSENDLLESVSYSARDISLVKKVDSVKGKELDFNIKPVDGLLGKDTAVVVVENSSDTDSNKGKEFDPDIISVRSILENPSGYGDSAVESSSDDDGAYQ